MSRETHRCEHCPRVTELYHIRCVDAYLCEECAEAVVDDDGEGNND